MTPVLRAEPPSVTTSLLSALHGATHAALSGMEPDLESEGLTQCTFWALYRLTSGGADHPGAIARQLGVTRPSVTQSVDQLVARGLVSRSRSEEDRRVVRLEVTAAGRHAVARLVRRLDQRFSEALAGCPTAEVESAARVLDTLAEGLREAPRPGALVEAA
jgi:DNA-binding MarR family transcriptional regulator